MASSARPVVEVANKAVVPGLRQTLWEQQDQKVTYPKLEKDASADVVVVGAGISGLSIAYNLAKAGKSVIVIESRVVGEDSPSFRGCKSQWNSFSCWIEE